MDVNRQFLVCRLTLTLYGLGHLGTKYLHETLGYLGTKSIPKVNQHAVSHSKKDFYILYGGSSPFSVKNNFEVLLAIIVEGNSYLVEIFFEL